MNFRIADTFTDSLACLTGIDQKAGKTRAFDLQPDAASPGLSFHKPDKETRLATRVPSRGRHGS